ncbi:GDNF family receptor alpha-3 [Myotis brandtii]|uniref:GDNF family receptor alpha-3 n=1 Tax=Myotis brandtii TaxID=109478 RepID=S7NK99_MYOBR|nr:GDNF family receptor alpha-3 [Myotis brandtii]
MARPANLLSALSVLLLLLPLLGAGDPLPTEGRLTNNCIQARRKCQANPTCNAAYHHLSSCTSSESTLSPAEEPSVSLDCLEAAQHLRNSSLMSCTCHRRMKNQTACLDIYWTVHPARSLGDYEPDVSPYEDTVTRKPWKMNISKLSMLKPDSDLCLKFAMLCTLNDKCDRLRKAYGEACSSGPHCRRSTCLQQLRAFFEKASEPHAQGLLLSRLADFQTHCHPMDILGTCATEQSRCLQAYMGLIGTAMTPNFISNVNTSVALSCTCRGSGNMQEECERLEELFSHNPCLMEAIAVKMRLHSQLFSQDWADSTLPVMERQNKNLALRPQPWMPSLLSCTLTLILLPSF